MSDKFLILGGNGFVGSSIAKRLVDNGMSVVIMDRSYPNIKNIGSILNDIEYVEADFFNNKILSKNLHDVKNVFHCITSTYPGNANDNPIYDIETNIIGTIKLLELLRYTSIKLFFMSSGGTVYGKPEYLPIDELHPTNPICSYGICKLTIEKYLDMYNLLYGLDYCIFRLSNPYGEIQDPRSGVGAIRIFLDKIYNNKTIIVRGNGESTRDYVYIDDVVDIIMLALHANLKYRIYNIGSGENVSINKLLKMIRNTVGKDFRVQYKDKGLFDIEDNYLNINRISNELKWHPKTNINYGISKMWQRILEDKYERTQNNYK